MTESLGTRDVLERILARMTSIEDELQQLRTEVAWELSSLRTDLRSELQQGLTSVRTEMQQLGARLDARLDITTRWLVGLMLVSWLSLMTSIWLRP